MNKKKLLVLAIAGVLTVGAIGAGTLAYFTDTQSVENVITMGDVDGDLTEPNYKPNPGGNEMTNLTPGSSFPKDPTITLKADSEDAYTRMTLKISALKDKAAFPLTIEEVKELMLGVDVNQNDWFVIEPTAADADGVYVYTLYYKDKLSNKEGNSNTATVFTTVTIPQLWGNKFKNVSIIMDVTADLIQADNFVPDYTNGMISGWGNAVVEK